MGKLDEQVAFISGGASGMGAAEARLFAAEGASVVIGDVQHDLGRDVVAKIGPASRYVELDVTSEESWARAAAFVDAEFGHLDVLINNAGVAPNPSALITLPLAEYRRVTEVNQTGVFLGMRAFAPALVRRGQGAIINVSSIAGLEGTPGALSYVASKFAVRGMTKVAALELAEFGVRVNSIHPGLINTPLSMHTPVVSPFANADGVDRETPTDPSAAHFGVKIPLGRPGQPDEVARLALFLASSDSSYCTGHEFVIDGGMTCGDAPTALREMVSKATAEAAHLTS